MKIDEYARGYRDGIRFAVSWLHHEALMKNHPPAKAVLNGAGFALGTETSKRVQAARVAYGLPAEPCVEPPPPEPCEE